MSGNDPSIGRTSLLCSRVLGLCSLTRLRAVGLEARQENRSIALGVGSENRTTPRHFRPSSKGVFRPAHSASCDSSRTTTRKETLVFAPTQYTKWYDTLKFERSELIQTPFSGPGWSIRLNRSNRCNCPPSRLFPLSLAPCIPARSHPQGLTLRFMVRP